VVKLTPKQDAFALAYVETGNASEAYRRAYDAENMSPDAIKVEACKLLAHPNVTITVVNIQEAAQERTLVTVESITKELEENRAIALGLDQAAAMNSATMGKAKLHGLLVDRKDHTSSDGSMSPVGEVPASERLAQMLKAIKPKGEIKQP